MPSPRKLNSDNLKKQRDEKLIIHHIRCCKMTPYISAIKSIPNKKKVPSENGSKA